MKKIIIDKQVMDDLNLIKFLKENNIKFRELDTNIKTKPCPLCGKKFTLKGVGTINEKKFCSISCRTRFNAKVDYNLKKNNPEYKQKRKEYFKKWRLENREHFNDLVREPNRIKSFEKYHKFDALGLCVLCGKDRDNPKSKVCIKCYKLRKKRRIKEGTKQNKQNDTRNNIKRRTRTRESKGIR